MNLAYTPAQPIFEGYPVAPTPALATPSLASAPGPGALTVLLVEDDEADGYLIEEALARIPAVGRVVRAHDGVEALSLVDAGETRPDLALIDLQMPRKDGLQLLAELQTRASVTFRSLVLTSSHSHVDLKRANRLGAWKYITKKPSIPAMRHALVRVIAKL